jgi:hypothetical protein
MHDERMISGATLGAEDGCHSLGVQGVSRQAVHCFSGQAYQLTLRQGLSGMQHLV